MLKYGVEYQQMSAQEYEQQFREREIRHLQRKAARLGFCREKGFSGSLFLNRYVSGQCVQ